MCFKRKAINKSVKEPEMKVESVQQFLSSLMKLLLV